MSARIAFAASSGATACTQRKSRGHFAQKTRAAFELMTKDEARWRARTGQSWFGRAKNRHERNSKTIGKVHGSCVISEENAKGLNPLDQIYRANLRFSVEPLKDFGCEVPVIAITDHSATRSSPACFPRLSHGQEPTIRADVGSLYRMFSQPGGLWANCASRLSYQRLHEPERP
jgi:hypothetical protein